MEWNGAKNNSKPLAFVGKGVCFDTGGYSLKPISLWKIWPTIWQDRFSSWFNENFALRKAKVNAVGVVGLVENMVSGNAQRPGDIVKSYSGKTIEILNGCRGKISSSRRINIYRKKFKPKFIVDLATLTGAIIVSLGSEYAGLFSNDDKLSQQIFNAGEKVKRKYGECHSIKIRLN